VAAAVVVPALPQGSAQAERRDGAALELIAAVARPGELNALQYGEEEARRNAAREAAKRAANDRSSRCRLASLWAV
jgi:hypothetical protein